MRIVLVNWAKIWDGASHGGGVNGYCQSLALALMERGHEVISLVSGTAYLDPPLPRGVRVPTGPSIRRHEDWLGVKVFEVLNSPVMAPSIVQFKRPLQEASCPELERVVGDLLAKLKPDVVHFNNIEGFSAGCVAEAKKAVSGRGGRGGRVVYSLHNYHTICPQVYLMQGHRKPCFDYDNGHNCVGCVDSEDPDEERAVRSANWKKKFAAGLTAEDRELHEAQRDLLRLFAWPVHVMRAGRRVLEARKKIANNKGPNGKLDRLTPGLDMERVGYDAPLPVQDGDTRGKTLEVVSERRGRPPVDPDHPTRKPLLNVIQPEPVSGKPLNDYGKRRSAMIDMLNACDHVLAVSDFVRRKFVSMGVDEERIETMHIGTRITRIVELARELVFAPPPFDKEHPRPIRLVFLGYNHYYKGLHVLAEALETLTPDQLAKIDLSIFALDGETIEHLFRRMEPRLAKLTFTCGYGYHDIPWLLGGKDLTVVSSVWWDNAPQTVMESMACGVPVLGSEIGGIPDFVKDGVNGLLFRANDHKDLARRLGEVLDDPWMLTGLRANVRPPKSIEAHAAEMERVYAGSGSLADTGEAGRAVPAARPAPRVLEPTPGPE